MSIRRVFSAIIVAIALLFGVSATSAVVSRAVVGRSLDDLNNRVFVAQRSASALLRAYVDQETGQRGFLLTGDPVFLEPYTAGRAQAAQAQTRLRQVLAGNTQAMTALDAVSAAANAWETTAAEPEIAARMAGPVPGEQIESLGLLGKGLFDALRNKAAQLQSRTDEMAARQLHRVSAAQHVARVVTYILVGLLLLIVVTALTVLPRLLNRPVTRLLRQVRAVSEGNYAIEIERNGPVEIATIADAVNHMRASILASIDDRLAAENALTRHDEQARMAADLHDRTINRVFGLGLLLTSAANRHPRVRSTLKPLIAETDEIISELRKVIFDLSHTDNPGAHAERGLSATVIRVVENIFDGTDTVPALEFRGAVDGSAVEPGLRLAVVEFLHTALGPMVPVVNPADLTVRLVATDDALCLQLAIRGDHAEADQTENLDRLSALIARLGGTLSAGTDESETTIAWTVPPGSMIGPG
ncbi:CHASE3 domain-containing protein [Nocardia sp. NEAU-G5]|uniref:CHASE3 domain-containing protein n=1 Tax=Nocardia albiluteola TaxID=2842303 RepID=A0ABS6B531_9NOCA|nr:CHASE3 domain-containing protein [Nocardia albiluteola]MBU3065418.1 CHASE3 domain-containing protein [Nocardia albiluteola]